MPMYFPKTALSASSTHLAGLRFKFLGVLVVVPVVVKAEWSQYQSSVKVDSQVFTPTVFTFGPERFTESQVEVDLSAGGQPTLTRTASSTYVHTLRKTEVRSGDQPKTHILYVFPVRTEDPLGNGFSQQPIPVVYGTYYPKTSDAKLAQAHRKSFVIPRMSNVYTAEFQQGVRDMVYDMTIAYYNGDNGHGLFKGDNQKTDYSVFSGRDVGENGRNGW